MKPAPFRYAKATTVEEAVSALVEYGPGARVLAGGQSLLQEMNLRQVRPDYLIDINPIGSLDYIREEGGRLTIGALTRHRTVETSELVRTRLPVLAEAARNIAHFQIRNRGTLGGALAQNSPGAEYGVVVRLLDAEIAIAGSGGVRTVTAADFFVSHYQTVVEPSELITAVSFPTLAEGAGSAFEELTARHGHLPLVSAAAVVEARDDTVETARVALGNVSHGVPHRLEAVTRLAGQPLSEDILDEFERAVAAEVQPDLAADENAAYVEGASRILSRRTMELAGEDFRRRVAGALARRTVAHAFARAGGK